ncbi:helix-turn-helix domain-containing protein [Lysobacter cavernae]|uniref:Helix-turn-helix domain-containing protein n=1 Tax=Lysobacter cavernae TaxID=1685901 RepID=A0ABV7RMT8_9GAMM
MNSTTQATAEHPLREAMLAHIEHNLREPELGIESLQTCFGVSRATVYRIFHNVGGVHSHIRERRLQAAHRHLRQFPDCNLTWLLYEIGFGSERQFQRAFQTHFAMAPSEWKRRCLQSAPADAPGAIPRYTRLWPQQVVHQLA